MASYDALFNAYCICDGKTTIVARLIERVWLRPIALHISIKDTIAYRVEHLSDPVQQHEQPMFEHHPGRTALSLHVKDITDEPVEQCPVHAFARTIHP